MSKNHLEYLIDALAKHAGEAVTEHANALRWMKEAREINDQLTALRQVSEANETHLRQQIAAALRQTAATKAALQAAVALLSKAKLKEFSRLQVEENAAVAAEEFAEVEARAAVATVDPRNGATEAPHLRCDTTAGYAPATFSGIYSPHKRH